ncbi:unnamed protein product, partial [Psylliodes chrysocephalus]
SRITNNLSTSTKITVYSTIIQPHFDYCASILPLFNLNKLNQLQKLQNRGKCIILKTNCLTPIATMLNSLQWFSIQQRLYYLTIMFIYKIIHSLAPFYFHQFICYHGDIHDCSTRSTNDIYIKKVNYSKS